ncbi:hypothetical protein H0H93_011489 [Arthromyces matolae]|nr:hypothetical protein H0H93_011489 [Arthromyces matolae]
MPGPNSGSLPPRSTRSSGQAPAAASLPAPKKKSKTSNEGSKTRPVPRPLKKTVTSDPDNQDDQFLINRAPFTGGSEVPSPMSEPPASLPPSPTTRNGPPATSLTPTARSGLPTTHSDPDDTSTPRTPSPNQQEGQEPATPSRSPYIEPRHLFDDDTVPGGDGAPAAATAPNVDDYEDDDDDDGDNELGGVDDVKGAYKSGPIRKEAKDKAFAYQNEFMTKMEALAREEGKPLRDFLILVGTIQPPARRQTSPWGIYQAWYSVEGKTKKRPEQSVAEWNQFVRTEYHDYLRKSLGDKYLDKAARIALMQPKKDWYDDKYNQLIEAKKMDGSFARVIAKTVGEFSQLAAIAFKFHDLHSFGFVMNLQPDHHGKTHSAMWGGSPAFVNMEKIYKPIIGQRTAEWESLLRVSELQRHHGEKKNDIQLWVVAPGTKDSDRDGLRKDFVAWLAKDIGELSIPSQLTTILMLHIRQRPLRSRPHEAG